jgi:hypothetical protein
LKYVGWGKVKGAGPAEVKEADSSLLEREERVDGAILLTMNSVSNSGKHSSQSPDVYKNNP